MFRFISVFALLACAGACLSAAGASGAALFNLSGSFNTDYYHLIRLDVDYGATSRPLDIDVTLGATGPGFDIELYDWDGYVAGLSGVRKSAQVMPGGSNSVQLTTVARSGVHPLLIQLSNIIELGQDADYAGGITLSGATLVSQADSDSLYNDPSDPWRLTYGDLAAGLVTYHPGTKPLSTLLRVDLGGQDRTFRFEAQAQGVRDMIVSWPDGAGGRRQYVVNADANGDIVLYVNQAPRFFTVPAQAGSVDVTVSIDPGPGFSSASWNVFAPGGASIVSLEAPGRPGGGSGNGETCSTGGGGWPLPAVVLGVVAVALLRRRRARQ